MPITCKNTAEVESSDRAQQVFSTLVRERASTGHVQVTLNQVLSSTAYFRQAVEASSQIHQLVDPETLAEVEALVIAEEGQRLCLSEGYTTEQLSYFISTVIGINGITRKNAALIKLKAVTISADLKEELDGCRSPESFISAINEHGGDNPKECAKQVLAYCAFVSWGFDDLENEGVLESISATYGFTEEDTAFAAACAVYDGANQHALLVEHAFSFSRENSESGVEEALDRATAKSAYPEEEGSDDYKITNVRAFQTFVTKMAREGYMFVREIPQVVNSDGRISVAQRKGWIKAK